MSAPDEREIAMLLAAHANRELTEAETGRLRALAAGDRRYARELAELDALLAAFDRERELQSELGAPTSPDEAADEGFRRLRAAAAGAEGRLRARLVHGDQLTPSVRRARARVRAYALVAVIAVAVALWIAFGGRGRPDLLDRPPGPSVAGGVAKIVLSAELSADRPELSWNAVLGASSYDAVIEDADGRLLVRRPEAASPSLRWLLSPEQFAVVHASPIGLVLRVVARDRAGLLVATTGDLPLRLVD